MDNYTIRELPDDASALKHLWCRSGVYYFVRRIPVDVQQHYRSKRVSMSLRTRSLAAAVRAAKSVMQRLDDYWMGLRLKQIDVPALHLLIFPRYCNNRGCKANPASAALNKWMKHGIGDGYVVHGLRHSRRDRLRAVECP